MAARTVGEDALLGARLLFIAAAAAEGGVETVDIERRLQRFRQHQA
jgi:hypothetical protein